MEKIKSRIREIAIIAILILGFVMYCGQQKMHYDIRKISSAELIYSENIEYELQKEYAKIYGAVGEEAVVESPLMYFPKGKYVFVTSYRTDSDNNVIQVVSDTTMDKEGNIGVVFAQKNLSKEENNARFEVEFEQDVTNLCVRVLYQDGSLELEEIVLRNMEQYKDPILFYLGFCLLLVIMYILYKKRDESIHRQEMWENAVLVLFLTAVATLPYMNDFLLKGHDLQFHLARIEGIAQGLMDGQFPVRINPIQTNSYGYASSVMYPQLFLYIPAILRVWGMSLLNSYKVLIFMINALTAICSYIAFKGVWKDRTIACIGCMFYMLGMYRLDCIYVRAAVGEVLGMAFLPLLFWGMYELLWEDYKKWGIAALGFSLVLQSHILSTEIFVVVTVVAFVGSMLFNDRKLERFKYISLAAVITLLCNLWFILPFVQYMLEGCAGTVGGAGVYLQDRTIYLSQFFTFFEHKEGGGNIPLGTTQGEMALSLGLFPIIVFLLYGYIRKEYSTYIKENKERLKADRMATLFLVVAVVVLLGISWMMPWEVVLNNSLIQKGLSTIQFLWRLISVILFSFCCALMSMSKILVDKYSTRKNTILFAALIIAIFLGWPAIDATKECATHPGKEYVANTNQTDSLYFYKGNDPSVGERGNVITCSDEEAIQCLEFKKEGLALETKLLALETAEELRVDVPFYYYPGYQAWLDGKLVNIERGERGVVQVVFEDIQKGDCKILEVRFVEPMLWEIGNIISIVTVIGCGVIGFTSSRKEKKYS